MPIPAIILAACAAVRVASVMKGLWHAYQVGRFGFQVIRQEGRLLRIYYKGQEYTAKLLRSGNFTVRGSSRGEVPEALVKELKTVFSRGEGFSGLYSSGTSATAQGLRGSVSFKGPW